MGKPAARMGDMTAHGGTIMMGFPMVLIGGMPAARMTDMHICPMLTPGVPPIPHVGGPVVMGSPMVLIGGMPAARLGDQAICVGPPDVIAMGCMTVLIGEGGSGSASGGGAMSSGAASAMAGALNATKGSIEASTKEEHWIEFEFTDDCGKPVSGVNYLLTDTSNKESSSMLQADGRIMRDALSKGECKVVLRDLYGAKWSKERVKVEDKVKLSVKSLGIKDGTKVEFTVFMKDIKYNDQILARIESEIKSNKSEVEWELKVDEEFLTVSDKNRKAGGYSQPFFYFDVYCNDLTAKSSLLYYEDWVEFEFKDETGKILSDKEYRIILSNGEVKEGKTDSGGKVKLEKIPPGVIDITITA